MEFASRVIFGESLELDLQGEIFTPLFWWDPVDEDEVKALLLENNLPVPANATIHINIINISQLDSVVVIVVVVELGSVIRVDLLRELYSNEIEEEDAKPTRVASLV